MKITLKGKYSEVRDYLEEFGGFITLKPYYAFGFDRDSKNCDEDIVVFTGNMKNVPLSEYGKEYPKIFNSLHKYERELGTDLFMYLSEEKGVETVIGLLNTVIKSERKYDIIMTDDSIEERYHEPEISEDIVILVEEFMEKHLGYAGLLDRIRGEVEC